MYKSRLLSQQKTKHTQKSSRPVRLALVSITSSNLDLRAREFHTPRELTPVRVPVLYDVFIISIRIVTHVPKSAAVYEMVKVESGGIVFHPVLPQIHARCTTTVEQMQSNYAFPLNEDVGLWV